MTPDLAEIRTLARQAGVIVSEGFGKPHQVAQKGFQDPVTEIDKKSESFLIDRILSLYPDHTILTEESGLHQSGSGSSDHVWFLDPLDGTMNYAHGIPFFCVSIGYAYKGELVMGAVYDPMRNECFYAGRGQGVWMNDQPIQGHPQTEPEKALLATGFNAKMHRLQLDNFAVFKHFMETTAGVRRMGSAALEICYVAAGRIDGMWEMTLSAWDVAAGFVIAREAGIIVTGLSGNQDCFKEPYAFLMANKTLHPWLLDEMKPLLKERNN